MDEREKRLIAIGGSVGAIGAVRTLCQSLPRDLGAALCVVVHVGGTGPI